MILIFVLHEAYGLGSDELPAPQGQALASMVEGILGGNVPIEKYIAEGTIRYSQRLHGTSRGVCD